MSTPTPGPWRLERGGSEDWQRGSFEVVVGDGWNGRLVLATRNPWTSRAEESEANGHLMAAAPTMLEVLEKVAKWGHVGHGTFPQAQCGLCKPVLAAIALARGGK